MKALIAMFALVLFGSASYAGQNVFTYRTAHVGQNKEGVFCPQIVTTTAVNETTSLRGKAVHVTDMSGLSDVFVYQNSTRECREDVICITKNHFGQKNSTAKLSLKLENNGSYPTIDLPGYTSMELSWTAADTGTFKSCTYLFF